MAAALKKSFGGSGSSKKSKGNAGAFKAVSDDHPLIAAREVIPTKWADEAFLARNGLLGDFKTMAVRAGLEKFAGLCTETYTSITHEFIASFEDNIDEARGNAIIKFSISGHRHEISFDEFCNIFGFPAGELIDKTISEEIRHQSASIWPLISMNDNTDFLRAKIAIIQNPTIRYFAYFLSNSLFARGEMSSMAAPDICVLYQSLQGELTPRGATSAHS